MILWDANEVLAGYDLRFYSTESAPSMLDQPSLEIDWTADTRTVYYLQDHLGSVRATVNDVGEVVSYDDYDAWGLILNGRSMTAQANLPNKFTGKEWDDDFGLNWNYFGARYYDPVIGRWLSVDPLSEQHPGWSPYNYTLNNPLRFFDPDGKKPKSVIKLSPIQVSVFNRFLRVRTNVLNSLDERAIQGGVLGFGANALGGAIEFFTPGSIVEILNQGAFGLLSTASKGSKFLSKRTKKGTDFVVTRKGEAIPIPEGASGPKNPKKGTGMVFEGGSGGKGMDKRVTGVRIMDSSKNQGKRVNFMNREGQTVDPKTGRTIPKDDRRGHIPLKEDE